MKIVKLSIAILAMTIPAAASAMPSQVPDRYYTFRLWLTDLWADHLSCHGGNWYC